MLQLILDKAIPKGETPTVITQRVLFLNSASIHTTTSVSNLTVTAHYVPLQRNAIIYADPHPCTLPPGRGARFARAPQGGD